MFSQGREKINTCTQSNILKRMHILPPPPSCKASKKPNLSQCWDFFSSQFTPACRRWWRCVPMDTSFPSIIDNTDRFIVKADKNPSKPGTFLLPCHRNATVNTYSHPPSHCVITWWRKKIALSCLS